MSHCSREISRGALGIGLKCDLGSTRKVGGKNQSEGKKEGVEELVGSLNCDQERRKWHVA
jgi:hypothetical protein